MTMTHAETLALDVLSYVENYYPDTVDDLEDGVMSLETTIGCILKRVPPGEVMSDDYRTDFLSDFAIVWADIYGAK